MFRISKIFTLGLLFFLSSVAAAGPIKVDSMRFWTAPDHTRMVFDVSSAPVHKVFRLDNPPRLVIDIKNARLTAPFSQPPADHPVFSAIRSGIRNGRDLRIVVDLKTPIRSKSFSLRPSHQYGNRLVVDLLPKYPLASTQMAGAKQTSAVRQVSQVVQKPLQVSRLPQQATGRNEQAAKRPEHKPEAVAGKIVKAAEKPIFENVQPLLETSLEKPSSVAVKSVSSRSRNIVVAIDAGHGGEDPGAHGPRGTQEKKVVFSIAQKLAAMIDRQPGMKAVLVRKGDYYIGLRKRMEIARQARADLFVSIHADAFRNSRAKGASVFTVSSRGATSEAARWLANHENSVDLELAGGVSLDDKDEMLASVLLDLSQTATKEASNNVGAKVLRNFGNIGHLHSRSVQKAGFMVLKSPDIPSILVETAFISNPHEEQKLRSGAHQHKMAKAIFHGVLDYFKEYAPPGTVMAGNFADGQSRHVIGHGDTLSGIAQKYGVSMRAIKAANSMAGNTVRVGQVLTIPADSG